MGAQTPKISLAPSPTAPPTSHAAEEPSPVTSNGTRIYKVHNQSKTISQLQPTNHSVPSNKSSQNHTVTNTSTPVTASKSINASIVKANASQIVESERHQKDQILDSIKSKWSKED